MSAQTMAEVFAPVEAHYRQQVLKETWGHLAPKRNKKYRGFIVFAIGCYGSDYLNPTVLSCELEGLSDSPWFFDALMEWLSSHQHCSSIGEDEDKDCKFKIGHVYRFNGYFRNYEFVGEFSQARMTCD